MAPGDTVRFILSSEEAMSTRWLPPPPPSSVVDGRGEGEEEEGEGEGEGREAPSETIRTCTKKKKLEIQVTQLHTYIAVQDESWIESRLLIMHTRTHIFALLEH